MFSTGSLNRRISLGLVILTVFFLGCTKKELREEKYTNGTIKERGYVKQDAEKNYVKVGVWTKWYENGQKKSEGPYADGKKAGVWIEWHENGQKASEGPYADDKQVGGA